MRETAIFPLPISGRFQLTFFIGKAKTPPYFYFRFILPTDLESVSRVEPPTLIISSKFEVDATIHYRVTALLVRIRYVTLWRFNLGQWSNMAGHVIDPLRSWLISYDDHNRPPLAMRLEPLRMRCITWPVRRGKIFRVYDPLWQNFQNSVRKVYIATPIAVVVCKVRENSPTGNRWNRALFTWQKTNIFFGSLSNCGYCADRAQSLPWPAPNIWLTIFQISSKSIHFRRSYRTEGLQQRISLVTKKLTGQKRTKRNNNKKKRTWIYRRFWRLFKITPTWLFATFLMFMCQDSTLILIFDPFCFPCSSMGRKNSALIAILQISAGSISSNSWLWCYCIVYLMWLQLYLPFQSHN